MKGFEREGEGMITNILCLMVGVVLGYTTCCLIVAVESNKHGKD